VRILALTADERAMLDGRAGEGVAMAMRIIVALARVRGAAALVPVASVHVDSSLYHGRAGLDFVERLVGLGARAVVPTTLNVGSLDLLHPGVVRSDPAFPGIQDEGRALMAACVALGGRATFTCAPYAVESRPALGTHIAWAESNAIVFANSVLGARTDRYGDFLDLCAAVTARAPLAGFHLDEFRRGGHVYDCTGLPDAALRSEIGLGALGTLVGAGTGDVVPVLVGLPADTGEDLLKAFGAAAAAAGSVGMFHAVGVTPEAATLAEATGGLEPLRHTVVGAGELRAARDALSTLSSGPLDAVSVGTPHASLSELETLAASLRSAGHVTPGVDAWVSTGRGVLALAERTGAADVIREHGFWFVVDTCTYVTPILAPTARRVMTNSGKWAHYAPANLGVEVAYAPLADCVRSAVAGQVVRFDEW